MSERLCTQCSKPMDNKHEPHPTRQELWDANGRLANELATLRRERDEAEAAQSEAEQELRFKGYHPCDIPACNCPHWHGGHAERRLRELVEHLSTLLTAIHGEGWERHGVEKAVGDGVAVVDGLREAIRYASRFNKDIQEARSALDKALIALTPPTTASAREEQANG